MSTHVRSSIGPIYMYLYLLHLQHQEHPPWASAIVDREKTTIEINTELIMVNFMTVPEITLK